MPATKRNHTVTEIKAGILVLAALVVVIGFIAAIRGCGPRGEAVNRFTASFSSIIGLDLGAEVRYGGVKAGKVVGIAPDPDNQSEIVVVFEVPTSVPVNHGSIATIEQISLTTAKHLEISTGEQGLPLHSNGDRIAAKSSSGDMFGIPDLDVVVNRLETLLAGLNTLLGVERAAQAEAAGGDEMVDLAAVAASLQTTLEAASSTLGNLDATIDENRDELGQIVERLVVIEDAATELLGNLNAAVEENREPLNQTMVNFALLSEEAASRLQELAESLAVTLAYLEQFSGQAGDLAETQRPTLEQILLNLDATARNLREFSEKLADQPNALIRGTKPKGRKDGGQ
jgi:phospholipid/cholesterol/gamma-HCH transport system substrate-binding protein